MSILPVIGMYWVWSSVFALGKLALAHSPPLFLTASRMLLAAVCLLSYLFLKKRSSLRLTKKQLGSLVLLGFFSIYLTNALEFWALKYLTAAKTCFIYSLSPFFAALFSYLHFREKMTLRKALGLSLGVLGVLPVLYVQSGTEGLITLFQGLSWPSLAMMGAALCSVYGWVLLRLTLRTETISPLSANGFSMLFGGIIALGHSLIIDPWAPTPVPSAQIFPFLGWTLLITLISNILCYNLYGLMLKRFTATLLSFVGLLSPLFASLHGWLFLRESPSWLILLSTCIISIGLWLVYHAELRQGYILKKQTV